MNKCDIIIPVYNAPEYVKLCVYALFKNTDPNTIGKVYLMNDNSNAFTKNLLENLKNKYSEKIVLVHNEQNLGFVKNVNKGLKQSNSDYILLLNTDCFIGNKSIEKMINHIKKNEKIGLICPISNNAANISLDMFPGFSYTMMDKLLEHKFSGMSFDACTVVGNCLMITRQCIDEVGYLDEIFGMGYGEETDYQFKAMQKGFEAKVAIDTYVFHKAEMSFSTTNQSSQQRKEKNLKIFFDRWSDSYHELHKKYQKNDPIKYILSHISKSDKTIDYDGMFILPFASKSSGGVRVIVDLINYMSINGSNFGMLNLYPGDYNEIILFNPATVYQINNIKAKMLIGTIYESMFLTKKLAQKYKSKILYFSQGYEFVFNNGLRYGEVEMSFKMPDHVISVSNYLTNEYKEIFNIDSITIINGIDTDLAITPKKNSSKVRKTVTMVLRNEPRKADYMIIDILKHITLKYDNVDVNLIINNKDMVLGVNNNPNVQINKFYGPISRPEIYGILKETDIFIDTSLSEGFGLMPLEAMAFGCVPIMSDSFGINDFASKNYNSIIIDKVNDVKAYMNALDDLLKNNKRYNELSKNAYETAKKFDFDRVIHQYQTTFKAILNDEIEPIKQNITQHDLNLLSNYLVSDEKLHKIISESKSFGTANNTVYVRKRYRMLRLMKDIIRTNIHLLKEFLKLIVRK